MRKSSLLKKLLPETGNQSSRYAITNNSTITCQVLERPSLTNVGTSQGPRVGDKTPIAAISEEYAKGDPIYVAKTLVSISTSYHWQCNK